MPVLPEVASSSTWPAPSNPRRSPDAPGENLTGADIRYQSGRGLTAMLSAQPDFSGVDAEVAWAAEIRRRLARVDAGTAATIPWSEARRRIRAAAGCGG